MSEPADFELRLRRKTASRYAVDAVFSRPGDEADVHPLRQPVAVRIDEARLLELAADSAAYGRALSHMLFDGAPALAAAFNEARVAAQSKQQPLRLRLSIATDAAELHGLRWETLRDPHNDQPLALSEQLILARALSSADWLPVTLRAKGELRALVVIAAPTGLEQFGLAAIDAPAEQTSALTGLASIPTTVLAAPRQATLAQITANLRDGYDILYLVAHGTFIDDDPWLFLDDGQGQVTQVPGADLVARLADLLVRPRLVVLASCQSAGDGSHTALAALGPRLASAGLPAVIAMQGVLEIETNAAFAPAFFRELQRDGRIDRALAAGRQTIAGQPDWWAPALFTRLRSGRIWYEPGFEHDDFQRWPALLRSLTNGKCTPILGPGLLDSLAGSTRDLAWRLAEANRFPLAPFDRDDLPQVAQFLAVNQSVDYLRDELAHVIRDSIRERAAPNTVLPPRAPLLQLLNAVGAQRRASDPAEPHRLLADLPVSIYLSANPDNLLAEALQAAGRPPQVQICPWYVEERHFVSHDIDPPKPAAPLVYHLLGHLSEPESLVITEDDYFRYLIGVKQNVELIPSDVQRALADTALLFLGFRFEDWSFRALLQSVLRLSGGKRRGKYAHVAVQIDPQEGATLNPQAARKYLKDYLGPVAAQLHSTNISIYWGNVEDFMRELRTRWDADQRASQDDSIWAGRPQ